jgi:hypothetical protein
MASNDIKDIKNFIAKYKHATDLNQAYLEFNLNWLNSFNKNLSNNVLYEFDCVRDERIYRECEMSKGVLRNFITSLEVMLKEIY